MWRLKYLKTEITLILKLDLLQWFYSPRVQIKLQEHKMASYSHLCTAASLKDQGKSQLVNPGDGTFLISN